MSCTTALTGRFGGDESLGRFLCKMSERLFQFVVPIDGSSRARASATCRNIPSPVYHPFPLCLTLHIYLFVILIDGIKRTWSSTSMNRILFCMDSVSDAFGWRMFLGNNGWMSVDGRGIKDRLDEKLLCLWAWASWWCPPSKTTLNLPPPIASNDNISFQSCLFFH